MAKRILVPLDRSEHAEDVLPIVADLARSSGATVRLLNVARIPEQKLGDYGRVVAYESQEMERITFSRLDYLREAEARLEGVPVESVVRFGDPADEIARGGGGLRRRSGGGHRPAARLVHPALSAPWRTALRRKSSVPLLVLSDR